jgi:hypothetical protein
MAQENVEIARYPITVRSTSRRRLEERLALRFPRLLAALTNTVLRLPQRSRLRRAVVRHAVRIAIEAANRGDYDAAFVLIPHGYETITPPELVGLGFEPVYRGRDGRLRFQQRWIAELGDFQQETKEVIDFGDRILLLARMKGAGLSSGATFDSELAYLLTVAGGRLIREQDFRSYAEALEAAGLSE